MPPDNLIPEPVERLLRIYVLDPSLAARHGTARIGETAISVRWEQNLLPGPIGEYLEVVDVDPGQRRVLPPGRSRTIRSCSRKTGSRRRSRTRSSTSRWSTRSR